MQNKSYVTGALGQGNIPNYLTVVRAVTFIPVIVCVYMDWALWAMALIVLAGLSDWLDGYLARRFDLLTPLGRVADPLADKLFINFSLLPALFMHSSALLVMVWVCVVMYDAHNTWRRRLEIGRAILNVPDTRSELPVHVISKSKTAVLFVLLAYCYAPAPWANEVVLDTLAVCTLVLIGYSWYTHVKRRY